MQPPPNITRKLNEERFLRAAEAESIELTVFLAGPYIDPAKKPGAAKKHLAARLRYHLHGSITEQGHVVTIGEYEELYKNDEVLLGELSNAALAEIKHSESTADAIVILPSSPGSFSELGAFALYEVICQKMLVIIDSQFEENKSYMNLGPVICAKNNGAEIAFLDYEDQASCEEKVAAFLKQRTYRKAMKAYLPK